MRSGAAKESASSVPYVSLLIKLDPFAAIPLGHFFKADAGDFGRIADRAEGNDQRADGFFDAALDAVHDAEQIGVCDFCTCNERLP